MRTEGNASNPIDRTKVPSGKITPTPYQKGKSIQRVPTSLPATTRVHPSATAIENEPQKGGGKQSRLRAKLDRYGKNKCYLPDAPEKTEIRGQGTKSVPDVVARMLFDADREGLKAFVHDVYYEYLEFALGRNYLNFGFLQLFARSSCSVRTTRFVSPLRSTTRWLTNSGTLARSSSS